MMDESQTSGRARHKVPLPDCDMDALRAGLHERRAEPHPFLKVGEGARIRYGGLAGMEGVVIRKKNMLRVVIRLDLIRQSVAVEVDWDELEPLGPAPVQ
jgi:transcription antitermination factor NusG